MTTNDAIIRVLFAQYKKDDTEAFNAVKNAGFSYYKVDGHWVVRNPETDRAVSAREEYSYTGRHKVRIDTGYYRVNTIRVPKDDVNKVNFVGILLKPVNRAYWERPYRTNTQDKVSNLRSAKQIVEWRKQDIARKKKEIAQLQAELERTIRWEFEAEISLADTRRELGLTRR